MIPILDNSGRARQVILFFWIYLGIQIVGLASECVQFWVLDTMESGKEISETLTTINTLQYALIALISVGVNIIVIVTFIQWFRRAYHNLQRAGYHTKHDEGWAAGSWFVPFLNIVRPYQIMKEIWYETQAVYTSKLETHGIVKAWWIMFLLKGWYENITARLSWKSETTSDLIRDAELNIFGNLFSIPCIVVTVMLIKQVSSFEEQFKQYLLIQTVGEKQVITEDNREEEFY